MSTITDEQIAEIEAFCNMAVFKDDANSPQSMGELRALISRLRAAERDAARYRWMRDNCDTASDIASACCGLKWDAAIDAAMALPEPNHPA